jgi:hypothetical protein
MKVTDITDQARPKFQPVILKVTIESYDELLALWHRLNIAPNDVQRLYKGSCTFPIDGGAWIATDAIWEILDKKIP